MKKIWLLTTLLVCGLLLTGCKNNDCLPNNWEIDNPETDNEAEYTWKYLALYPFWTEVKPQEPDYSWMTVQKLYNDSNIKSSTDDQRYTDLHIFDISNIEKNWENQCISGLHDWLKNMEPNWVFSEIVWNNDNWENAFKVDWMNMKTKSWIMYYTNDNTKRKLDFQCRAEVEAASTSTSFWNVEFVE